MLSKWGDNIDTYEFMKNHYGITVSEDSVIKRRLLNEYYIITSSENKKYFLKSYPERGKTLISESNFDNLAAITDYLVNNNIKTPRVITTLDGKNCIKNQNNWYILYEYFQVNECQQQCSSLQLGEYLSRLHSVLNKADMKPFDSWMLSLYDYKIIIELLNQFDDFIGRKKGTKYTEEEYYLSHRNTILKHVESLESFINELNGSDEKQFIHGDLHPENMIQLQNDISLIDLDSIHYGSILEDYATVTSHIFIIDNHRSFECQKEQYSIFRTHYRQRELLYSSMIFRGMIYDWLKNMANLVTNWRLVSRFEVARKVLLDIMKQIVMIMDNHDKFEKLL